jgi:hypothetical protein
LWTGTVAHPACFRSLCLYRAGYDFKKLFAISEYYVGDRARFYTAIQNVREHGMDLTGWLDYFVEGLAVQMNEVTGRGKRVIRRDAIAQKFELSLRQALAVGHLIENPLLHIEDYERLCPGVHRRTLQRDIKGLVEKGVSKADALTTLDRFDHGSLAIEQTTRPVPYVITYEVAMEIVKTMKAGPLFSPDVRLCGPA